jgi:Ser/Thr protein kinase RdoA (MazF antagonist)
MIMAKVIHDVLRAWGDLAVLGPLGGGNRNTVLELRRGSQRLVARTSRRPGDSLDWEIRLLDHLAAHGFLVPAIVPALDGRQQVDRVVVQTWIDGAPPVSKDWVTVAAELRRLHHVTAGWPQRPGSASTRDLLTAQRGDDVELSAMPGDAVASCRQAWARLDGVPEAVVHGDPGPANIRICSAGVGLLDWDEARVDHVDLDLGCRTAICPRTGLPSPRPRQPRGRRPTAGWSSPPTRGASWPGFSPESIHSAPARQVVDRWHAAVAA